LSVHKRHHLDIYSDILGPATSIDGSHVARPVSAEKGDFMNRLRLFALDALTPNFRGCPKEVRHAAGERSMGTFLWPFALSGK
jgi:hypothetical protein